MFRPHGIGHNAPFSVVDAKTLERAPGCESLFSYAEAERKATELNIQHGFGNTSGDEWDWN